jgi:hypothetical protein
MLLIVQFAFGPIGRILIVAAAFFAAVFAYTAHERSVGAAKIEASIAQQNRKAVNEADSAEQRVRACFSTNGVWNDAAGKCTGP